MQRQSSGSKPLDFLREQSHIHSGNTQTSRAAAAAQARRAELSKRQRESSEALVALDRAIHNRDASVIKKIEGYRPGGLGDLLRASVAAGKQKGAK